MKTQDAIEFLKAHQPMPSDSDITDEEGETFAAIIKHFENHPDPEIVPFLIGAVSPDTGLGMYDHINFVLMALPPETVIPHLRHGLQHGNHGTKSRCCYWATDIDAWELEDLIKPLANHEDQEIQEAASMFLQLKEELA